MSAIFGAYGAYILAAYGATALAFAGLAIFAASRLRHWAKRARQKDAP